MKRYFQFTKTHNARKNPFANRNAGKKYPINDRYGQFIGERI
jgi:hypothetical protein